MSKGANPDAKGKNGFTPLSSATYAGHLDIIKALIESGAAIESNDARWTLVHYAANYGQVEILEYFIDRGIDINQRTSKGSTSHVWLLPQDMRTL